MITTQPQFATVATGPENATIVADPALKMGHHAAHAMDQETAEAVMDAAHTNKFKPIHS